MERNLMVAGFGGQGVMTLGKFLAEATCESTDKNVTFFPSYGAEQRGGTANCYVVIADESGRRYWGVGVDSDITMASVYALITAVNRANKDNQFIPTND